METKQQTQSEKTAPRKKPFEFHELKFPLFGVDLADFKKGELDRLLAGGKTGVHEFVIKTDSTDANSKWEAKPSRIQLHRKPDNSLGVKIISKLEKFEIPKTIFGVDIKEDVTSKINAGKSVLVDGFVKDGGKPFSMWLHKDEKLNRLEMTKASLIEIPRYVHGVKVDEEAAAKLKKGETLSFDVTAKSKTGGEAVNRSIEVSVNMESKKVIFNYIDVQTENGKKVENKTSEVIRESKTEKPTEEKTTKTKKFVATEESTETKKTKKSQKVA